MVTVKPAVPVTPPLLAEMLAAPEATPSTMPPCVTVAIFGADEVQFALEVKSAVLPSV